MEAPVEFPVIPRNNVMYFPLGMLQPQFADPVDLGAAPSDQGLPPGPGDPFVTFQEFHPNDLSSLGALGAGPTL